MTQKKKNVEQSRLENLIQFSTNKRSIGSEIRSCVAAALASKKMQCDVTLSLSSQCDRVQLAHILSHFSSRL